MTAIWGPLGWMTLHSMTTSYPEVPSETERTLMTTWLDMFRDTITCVSCREHFTRLLVNYRSVYPHFLASRQSFSMFAFRAHNAVNLRLHKPTYASVEECLAQLRKVVEGKSALQYRTAYLNHIGRFWRSLQDVSGIVALKKVLEMKKIEVEYMRSRDTNFAVTLAEEGAILPRSVMERYDDGSGGGGGAPPTLRFNTSTVRAGLHFTSAGFRLRR